MTQRVLTLGHSPDSDDAFMFYALAAGLIDTGSLRYEHIIQDIESLNQRAEKGELDITAVSVHAYAYVSDKYVLSPCGASVGEGYGPILVARKGDTLETVRGGMIAVPGERTSAFLALRLFFGEFRYEVVPFDKILERVASGEADAGLIIHEGQLTYGDLDLENVADLGKWWFEETGLVLPLGAVAIKRDLEPEIALTIVRHLRQSFEYGLAHRGNALEHASHYARELDPKRMDRFVGMYVNEWTLDLGPEGRKAVREFLRRGAEAGVIPRMPAVDFVEQLPPLSKGGRGDWSQ